MRRVVLVLLIIILHADLGYTSCNSLAKKFAESPNSMDLNELAALDKCISDTMRQRLFSDMMPVATTPISGSSSSPTHTAPVPSMPNSPVPSNPVPPIVPSAPGPGF